MDTINEFFITLHNWTSTKLFPTNVLGDFYTKLPAPIDLYGDWKVGLTSFCIPKKWYNVNKFLNYVDIYTVDNSDGIRCEIDTGYYEDIVTLLQAINASIIKKGISYNVEFGYEKLRKKVYVTTEIELITINIPSGLCGILGFDTDQKITFSQSAKYSPNIDGDQQIIYVLCDLGEEQIIGENKLSVLATLDTSGFKYGESLHKNDDVSYVNVKNKNFEVIHIWIVDVNGDIVNFFSSKSLFNLHLIRI